MARRKIERSSSSQVNVLNVKTGEWDNVPEIPMICNKIKYYRNKKGLEQKALGALLGISGNTVCNWENGRARPDLNLLPSLCSTLGITYYQLFDEENPLDELDSREHRVIDRYRSLTPGNKLVVDKMMDYLILAQDAAKCPEIRKLTVFQKALAAGFGDPTEFEGEGEPIYLYATDDVNRADCVFTVSGESMEPAYCDGDMVLVQRVPGGYGLQYGETGAFVIGNEAYIKQYEKDGLHSLNPAFSTMHFSDEESVYLIGRVIAVVDPETIASQKDVELYEKLHPETT